MRRPMDPLTPVLAANLHCLDQAIVLLERMPESAFARVDTRHARTAGPHLRHVLDHYSSFLSGLPEFRIDYDARERDPRLETSIAFAVDRLREISGGLVLLDQELLEMPIEVRLESGGPEEEQWSRSTVRRELQFLLSHTVHHFALIALVLERHGVEVPEDFGVAPSTLKHWQSHQSVSSPPAS
ncbi:MAG: DinB family protein [Thermoanaerobaculia bacterium]